MKICRMLMIASCVLVTVPVAFGQSEPPVPPPPQQQPVEGNQEKASPCPQIAIQSPTPRSVREGQPVTFNARIIGGDRAVMPSILWNVSGASIRDGQGTIRIDVDSTGAGAYREIVAELWLGGYAAECVVQTPPYRVRVIPPALKLDEFGPLTAEAENEKLAAAIQAAQPGNDKVFLIGYAGRKSERMYASTSLRRMRDHVLKSGFAPARINAFDGGFREEPAFEVWIVPEGAEPPRPTPTIDRKDIVFPTTTRARPTVRRP